MIKRISSGGPWEDAFGYSRAVIAGPHAYVSPAWYATKAETGKVVPTWNYEVLNVYGHLVAHDDPAWVLDLVTALTNRHERHRATPWQVSDAPESYLRGQLNAIVGLELVISRVEGKAKMSQNQPPRNRAGVVAGLRQSGDVAAQSVADRVAALSDVPDTGTTNANGRA